MRHLRSTAMVFHPDWCTVPFRQAQGDGVAEHLLTILLVAGNRFFFDCRMLLIFFPCSFLKTFEITFIILPLLATLPASWH
jgi:TRAP-type mannitol/chloroaromatic compound transport system permease large subunit